MSEAMDKVKNSFKTAGNAIKNFFLKLGVAHTSCIALILVSAILGISLVAWAQTDTSAADIEIREAEVLFGEASRTEYITGEAIDPAGISLSANGMVYEDVQISCDLSSAGLKRAEVSVQDGNVYWRGYYPITVYTIRHYDVKNIPTSFDTDEDGNLVANGIVIWADLNAKPAEIPTVAEFDKVIELPASMYDVTVKANDDYAGAYNLSIAFGDNKINYFCVNAGGRMIALNSPERILSLANTAGGAETLTLYVTQIEATNSDGANGATGVYVYTDADGNVSTYDFDFYLDGYTVSHFHSGDNNQGLTDSYANDGSEGFFAEVDGVKFKAEKLPWHKAILNWDY